MDLSLRHPPLVAWNLLVAACSPAPRAVDLHSEVRQQVNWDVVLRLADQHGASSLLYRRLALLAPAVPTAVLLELRLKYEKNIHKALFLARELIRILDRLDSLGIDALPYKGVVMSEVYYGDVAMRQAGDMDLFVRTVDVPRIKNAVRDLEYTARLTIPADAEADYIASGYEYTFDSPAGTNLLEVQWALQPRYYAVDCDMRGIFARAIRISVAGRELKTPSPEDLLIVLALHAAKHVWGRLIWLRDIAQILMRDALNWDWICAESRRLGIECLLHITLLLTAQFLEITLPAAIQKTIANNNAAQALAREISSSIIAGVVYEEEKFSYFRLMMRLRERKVDRLRFLSRLAFTPGPGEWEAIRLPRPLCLLYPMVRLSRLAARMARG